MKIIHILTGGAVGGIEILNKDICLNSRHENHFFFMFEGGSIAEEIKKSGAPVYIGVGKRPLKIFFKLKKIIKKRHIDAMVIHHSAPMAWSIGDILSAMYNIPMYIYIHGDINDELSSKHGNIISKIKKIIFAFSALRAKNIITISDHVSKTVSSMFPERKDKIVRIYNGVNTDRFRPYPERHEVFTLIYVGRLIEVKGLDLLIEALKKVDCPYKCFIVGDGEERGELESMVKEKGMNDYVSFLGVKRDVEKWYRKADVFVHPAVWEEGFGVTLVEAMASGVPCVAFRRGAIPEIIEDGVNGFLVDKTNSDQLAEKIMYVYRTIKNEPDIWSRVRASARKKSEMFSIEKMVGSLDMLFENK